MDSTKERKETFSEFEKRRVMSIIGEGRDLMEMVSAKIYTNDKEGRSWLFSDLEGFLCHIIDYNEKTQYLFLYDYNSLEKHLQFELYQDFSNYYTVLNESFHCFETIQGFMGIKFIEESEAASFYSKIKKYDTKTLNMLFKKSSNITRRKYVKGCENVTLLSEKFSKEFPISSNLDGLKEDGIEILKPGYYELFNNISYDRQKRSFKINTISKEMTELLKLAGVKKKDFKNESMALKIFKYFAICYDKLHMIKLSQTQDVHKIDSHRVFLKNEIRKDDNIEKLLQRNSISTIETEKLTEAIRELNLVKTKTGIKLPAAPKLPVPKLPNLVKSQSQVIEKESPEMIIDLSNVSLKGSMISQNDDTPKKSITSNTTSNSFFDEIRKGIQTKKITETTQEEKRPVKINKEDVNYLQAALSHAIKQRREELTKNDVESSGEESDWSD
jgi:hypothetical protein